MDPSSTDPDLASARALAERVIERFGAHAPPMGIKRLGYVGPGIGPARDHLSTDPTPVVLIEIRIEGSPASRFGAHFTIGTPREWAVTATAGQIQDGALEHTRGDPLPPCPGHVHPLQADVVDGVASWVCPKDRDHHVEPVMPTASDPTI